MWLNTLILILSQFGKDKYILSFVKIVVFSDSVDVLFNQRIFIFPSMTEKGSLSLKRRDVEFKGKVVDRRRTVAYPG